LIEEDDPPEEIVLTPKDTHEEFMKHDGYKKIVERLNLELV